MEERTTVVNLNDDDYEVFIGRPSIWGNPFKIGVHGTREEVLDKFREYLKTVPHLVELAHDLLKGRVLGCYCKPLPCHGDAWCEILNNKETKGEE